MPWGIEARYPLLSTGRTLGRQVSSTFTGTHIPPHLIASCFKSGNRIEHGYPRISFYSIFPLFTTKDSIAAEASERQNGLYQVGHGEDLQRAAHNRFSPSWKTSERGL